MSTALFNLEEWDRCTQEECEALMHALILPQGFRFSHIAACALGAQKRYIAFFSACDSSFALIPGGSVTLGYDRSYAFRPSRCQKISWQQTREEWNALPLDEYLDQNLTPLRTVEIRPFFLETMARPFGREPLLDTDLDPSGGYIARQVTWEEVRTAIAEQGLRLPTSDEWEYACAAGTRTLFRWGDTCPIKNCRDLIPGQSELAEVPNAFGLTIGTNSYNWEFCADASIWRGGDGGGTGCGGYGCFAYWITLASSFWFPKLESRDGYFGVHARRACSLPEQ